MVACNGCHGGCFHPKNRNIFKNLGISQIGRQLRCSRDPMATQAYFGKCSDFRKTKRLPFFRGTSGVDIDARNELSRSIASVVTEGIPIGYVKQLLR